VVRKGAKSDEILADIGDNEAAVVHFTSMPPLSFGGFSDPKKQEEFLEFFRVILGIWCCENGHIW
jgi:hypothetical protein